MLPPVILSAAKDLKKLVRATVELREIGCPMFSIGVKAAFEILRCAQDDRGKHGAVV
jgi:hypothetical protein